MITPVVLVVVIALAVVAAYAAEDSTARLALALIAGVAAIVGLFVVAVILPSPQGDGWPNRSQVWGHWVPTWQANLEVWSVLAWLAAIWGGSGDSAPLGKDPPPSGCSPARWRRSAPLRTATRRAQ